MVYSTYDEAVASIITSKVDFIILVHIRDLFTYMQTEVSISSADIAKLFGVSKPKVTRLISAMLEHSLLYRVSKGIYRLNPFMFLPYKSNGATLQADWKTLTAK
jgi:predicted regulator of amino acid metabolism with ACT domain